MSVGIASFHACQLLLYLIAYQLSCETLFRTTHARERLTDGQYTEMEMEMEMQLR